MTKKKLRAEDRALMSKKGRAKLTPDQVRQLRDYQGNVAAYARRLGIGARAAYAIRRRETWKDV